MLTNQLFTLEIFDEQKNRDATRFSRQIKQNSILAEPMKYNHKTKQLKSSLSSFQTNSRI